MFAWFCSWYLGFVVLTSRIRIRSESQDAVLALREQRQGVYTFWFRNSIFMVYFFGNRRVPLLMTPPGRTDFITSFARWMKAPTVIGSLEGGGRHALVSMLETLKAGRPVALAADGPRGPDKKCKAGPFMLAQDSGAPLVPVSWNAWLTINLPRRNVPLKMPLPFNSIEVQIGTPLSVDKHYQFDELEAVKAQLVAQLDRLAK